jgi:hypothetical protein
LGSSQDRTPKENRQAEIHSGTAERSIGENESTLGSKKEGTGKAESGEGGCLSDMRYRAS